jgi:hypothetical protein
VHRFKPFVLASLAVALLIGSVAPAAAAPDLGRGWNGNQSWAGNQTGRNQDGNVADAWFLGTATSGAPAPNMPININPADVAVRTDGAVGIGYIYMAAGETQGGQASGRFQYEERGYLYFRNPADPTSYMGSQFKSGVFTLTLKKGGVVSIVDTNPAAYTSGVKTISIADSKGIAKELHKLFAKNSPWVQGGTLTYGWFTFTNSYGTYTGYATPDFRQFLIHLTFNCPVCK